MPVASPFAQLSDELLTEAILAKCELEDRLKALPLVCRRFHQLLRQPGECWRRVAYQGRGCAGESEPDPERMLSFLRWAELRAAGLQGIQLELSDMFSDGEPCDDGRIGAAVVSLLKAAGGSLIQLDLNSPCNLPLEALLPPSIQQMQCLRALHLEAVDFISGLRLGDSSSLQSLHMVGIPAYTLEITLPHSLTAMILRSMPDLNSDDNHWLEIPPCVLQLPNLQRMDLAGHEDARQPVPLDGVLHLASRTALTALLVVNCEVPTVPAQMELLANLRLLSLCGSLRGPNPTQAVDVSAVAAMRSLRVLDLRRCDRLHALPTEVAQMAQLKVLLLANTSLADLPPALHLPKLRWLSIDWRVLLSSHPLLPRLTALEQLFMASAAAGGPAAAGQAPVDATAVTTSLQALPGMQLKSVIEDGMPFGMEVAMLWMQLVRCPGLHVDLLPSVDFWGMECPADLLAA